MIVVTGGAGFIGSNIVKTLNDCGCDDVLIVDDLINGRQYRNIVDCNIVDCLTQEAFFNKVITRDKSLDSIKAIFHEGACSDTTNWDGPFMMRNNYEYSKTLLHYCLDQKIQFLYASSAAVYGKSELFDEEGGHEAPLNLYGYSKFLFDQYVRRLLPNIQSQVAGFRYFNVYGPRESHKGTMASTAFHFNNQIQQQGIAKLFEGTQGYQNGEQLRDFVYVGDVVDVNLWLHRNPKYSGIFNVGTGRSQSFNDIANAVIAWHGKGKIEYVPFPDHLKGCYQNFTQADISKLRQIGCDVEFRTVEQGVKKYLDWLNGK